MKSMYPEWVSNYCEEFGENAKVRTGIRRRGGWIQFLADDILIHQTHGYYDMHRYFVEHYKEIEDMLLKHSEAKRKCEA